MKAVGYKKSLPIEAADALIDFETEKPEPANRDIRDWTSRTALRPKRFGIRLRTSS